MKKAFTKNRKNKEEIEYDFQRFKAADARQAEAKAAHEACQYLRMLHTAGILERA